MSSRARTVYRRLAMASLAVALGLAASPAVAAGTTDAAGNWQHPDTGAIISFFDCGGDLCAKILKPSQPGLKDDKNSDEAKRSVPLEGLSILDHAKKSDDATWKGNLYNAEDGKTYSGYVSLLAPDKLQLKGCALVVFCKSIVFNKAAAQ